MQYSYKNQPEDEFLPEHTKSMRKALQYCHQLVQDYHQNHSIPPPLLSCNKVAALVDGSYNLTPLPVIETDPQAKEAAHRIQEHRQQALIEFWKRQQEWFDCCGTTQGKEDGGMPPPALASPKSRNSSEEVVHNMVIETIDMASSSSASSSSSSPPPTAVSFRQRFQNANQPCIIRGLDKTTYFSSVCSKWRQQSNADTHANHRPKNYPVNKDWFRMTIGGNTMVPVRYQPFSSSHSDANALDAEGRAQECNTKNMTLDQWMVLLEQSGEKEFYGDHYLKDWHLQSFLRDSANQNQPERITETNTSHTEPFLYEVPPYFEHDILNGFLTKFTQKGDYKFTYWGPKGSRTSLHSDVMNSYSWSFNVCGTKEWKFYPPQLSSSSASSTPSSGDEQQNPPSPSNPTTSESAALVVVQHAGECIFVPCGWKHEVTNLDESLSINHNWITTGNIDQTWDCLCQEMKAIETELKAWSIDESCWDARESMLRGCVGLDVSAFFLMILTRLLELLLLRLEALEYKGSNGIGSDDTNTHWTLHFDLARLKEALRSLLCPQDEDVNIEKRLSAVLQSGEAATSAVKIAVWAMESIS